jgi:transposase-like protein
MMVERGIVVEHSTSHRWTFHYVLHQREQFRLCKRSATVVSEEPGAAPRR